MARQEIDLTTPQPNGKMGEPTKSAWEKVNDMTAELYPLAEGALPSTGGNITGSISQDLGIATKAFSSAGGGNSSTTGSTNFAPYFESVLKNRFSGALNARFYLTEYVGNYSEAVIQAPDSAFFRFRQNGQAYCTQWNNTSDKRIKRNASLILDAENKILKISGYSYEKQSSINSNAEFYQSYGFFAGDVDKVLPGSASVVSPRGVGADGEEILDVLGLADTPILALAVEAIKSLIHKVNELETIINSKNGN